MTAPEKADVVIYSCFGDSHKQWIGRDKKMVFVSAENTRPRDKADLNLTCDLTEGKNVRLPIWWRYIDWLRSAVGYSAERMPADFLIEPIASRRRDRFACIVANNMTPLRQLLVREVETVGVVDKWGAPFGQVLSSNFRKLMKLRRYLFNICPENETYPGYVTEKAVQAWCMGCIPIYQGGSEGELDPRSYVNAATFEPDELLGCRVPSYFEQPLVLHVPENEEIAAVVERVLI